VARTKQGQSGESTKDEVVRTKQPRSRESGKDENGTGKVYDLTERTARFGEAVIRLTRQLGRTPVSAPLISQVVRSSTGVGANYMEAGAAQSGKDFDHKIAICKQEARETMHWLRMLTAADESLRPECQSLWREAHELTMIFSAILKKRRP
jgi:four helix bundle protein